MANLINIHGEPGANIIGDGTEPALTLQVIGSTGPGGQVHGLVVTSTASVDIVNTTRVNSANATTPVQVNQTVVGNQSIGILQIVGNSVASGAALEFRNKAFISITSTVLTTVANTDYAIVVQVGNQTRYIPCFQAAALIGGAAF